ncbi:hypothetical protein ACFL43_02895 [Thermodesulfobacteriota bacterium]
MDIDKVINAVESSIKIICSDIKKNKGCGSEKLGRLSQLVNAYTRLINNTEEVDSEIDSHLNH